MPASPQHSRIRRRDVLTSVRRHAQALGACVQLLQETEQLYATTMRSIQENVPHETSSEEEWRALQRTEAELRTHMERVETLVALHRLLATTSSTTRILRSITRTTASLLRLPHVSLWTTDTVAQTLTLQAASNAKLRQSFPDSILQFGQGSPGWVAQARQSLHVPDVFADDRVIAKSWWQDHQFRSRFALPVLAGPALVGVLTMIGTRPFCFTPDEQQTLHHLLDLTAAALELSPVSTTRPLPPRKLQQIREYIDAHLAESLSLQEMAAVVGLSPTYFARCFTQAMDQTPYQYVLERRMAHAKQLLTTTDIPIITVAQAAGFASQSHLTATLRRVLGCTPKAFRNCL